MDVKEYIEVFTKDEDPNQPKLNINDLEKIDTIFHDMEWAVLKDLDKEARNCAWLMYLSVEGDYAGRGLSNHILKE